MSLQTALVEITVPSTPQEVSVTSLSFTPQLVRFFSNSQTDNTATNADFRFMFGAMDSYGNQFSYSAQSDDNQGTTDVSRTGDTATCIRIIFPTGVEVVAEYVSMNSDGFTVDFTTTGLTGQKIFCLCIAGATDIRVGTFDDYNDSTTLEEVSYTVATGHQPDALEIYSGCTTSVAGGVSFFISYGMTDGVNVANISINSQDNVDISSTNRYQSTDNIFTVCSLGVSSAILDQAEFVSFDSNGFTLEWTTSNNPGFPMSYISYQGVDAYVDTITQNATTGTQGYTGVGFEPEVLLSMGINLNAASAIYTSAKLQHGVAIGTGGNEAASICAQDLNNKDTSDAFRSNYWGRFLYSATRVPATEYAAVLDSFDTDGFTLDWVATDAATRLFYVLALKGSSSSTILPIIMNQMNQFNGGIYEAN